MTANNDDIAYIRKRVDDVYDLTSDNRERLAKLETKAGIWGSIGGFFSGLLAALLFRH